MFNIFGNKQKKEEILAPLTGEVLALSEVPDKVFAAKTVGDGVAIKPTGNQLLAPVAGEVKQLFPTKHALGIETETGVELLIHIGINTVELDGEGFEKFVDKGDQINVGDKLIEFDLDYIAENATSIITPVVITNIKDLEGFEIADLKQVTAGQDKLLTVNVE